MNEYWVELQKYFLNLIHYSTIVSFWIIFSHNLNPIKRVNISSHAYQLLYNYIKIWNDIKLEVLFIY
jgi:hypothetical protein